MKVELMPFTLPYLKWPREVPGGCELIGWHWLLPVTVLSSHVFHKGTHHEQIFLRNAHYHQTRSGLFHNTENNVESCVNKEI